LIAHDIGLQAHPEPVAARSALQRTGAGCRSSACNPQARRIGMAHGSPVNGHTPGHWGRQLPHRAVAACPSA